MIRTQWLDSLGFPRVLKGSNGWRAATPASTIALRLLALAHAQASFGVPVLAFFRRLPRFRCP